MSETTGEQERLLKQEAYRMKQREFYKERGHWPSDKEISETSEVFSETTAPVNQPHDPFDNLFEPRN